MASTTHQSHAKDPQGGSYVPLKAQEKLPKGVEDAVPDASQFELFSFSFGRSLASDVLRIVISFGIVEPNFLFCLPLKRPPRV